MKHIVVVPPEGMDISPSEGEIDRVINTNQSNIKIVNHNIEKGYVSADEMVKAMQQADVDLNALRSGSLEFQQMNDTARAYFYAAPAWWTSGT